MSFLKPDPPVIMQAPKAPDATPPVMNPQGSKPGPKNNQQTFLGSAGAMAPPSSSGGTTGKTLLGQ